MFIHSVDLNNLFIFGQDIINLLEKLLLTDYFGLLGSFPPSKNIRKRKKKGYVLIFDKVYAQRYNKELFENAPPHMIIRPYFRDGLYISSN